MVFHVKKNEWQKLEEFLKKELRLREKLTLDYKSAEMMGLNLSRDVSARIAKGDKKNEILANSSHKTVISSDKFCHICDKDGHTKIVTRRGNTIIPYYVCENFVKMSPKEAFEIEVQKFVLQLPLPGRSKRAKTQVPFYLLLLPIA